MCNVQSAKCLLCVCVDVCTYSYNAAIFWCVYVCVSLCISVPMCACLCVVANTDCLHIWLEVSASHGLQDVAPQDCEVGRVFAGHGLQDVVSQALVNSIVGGHCPHNFS